MLGTQKLVLPGGSAQSKDAFSVRKGVWGTGNKRSMKRDAVTVLVNMQSPEVLLTCAQAGKSCGREGGRFSKEVTGPDYSNVLIMSQ